MGMERLLSGDNLGHQVVGAVQKLFQTGGYLQGWVGEKVIRLQDLTIRSKDGFSPEGLSFDPLERVKPLIRSAGSRSKIDLLDLLAENESTGLVTAVLGVNGEGRPLTVDFFAPDMHNVLVAGEMGSGKSALIRSMLIGLILNNNQRQLQLAMVEYNRAGRRWGPNGSGYKPIGHLPHAIAPAAADYTEIVELVGLLSQELDRRKQEGIETPIIVLVLDNFDRLMAEAGRTLRSQIIHLLQEGRYAGFRLIVGLRQVNDIESLPLIRMNFPVKLVGKVRNRGHLRQLATPDREQIRLLEELQLRSRSGDFIGFAHGHAVPFRAAHIDDYDTYTVVTTLNRRRSQTIVAKPRDSQKEKISADGIGAVHSNNHGIGQDHPFPDQVDWEDSLSEALEIHPIIYEDIDE